MVIRIDIPVIGVILMQIHEVGIDTPSSFIPFLYRVGIDPKKYNENGQTKNEQGKGFDLVFGVQM